VITLEGAKKLLDAKPLKKMVPVDEYLPIMFDRHPNESWYSHFKTRNLVAWSAAPLLLFPTHYTGEEGYISDTEDSIRIDKVINGTESKGDKENIGDLSVESSPNINTEHDIRVKTGREEL
jgi:collagen beta-1,O-galactosyltransferase